MAKKGPRGRERAARPFGRPGSRGKPGLSVAFLAARGSFDPVHRRGRGHTLRVMAAPIFEWECPTFGCLGVIVTDDPPRHGTTAVCEPNPDSRRQVCRREMSWEEIPGRWRPSVPFLAFPGSDTERPDS